MKRISFLCTAVMVLLFFASCDNASTSNESDRTSSEVSSTDEASSQPKDGDIIIKMAIHTSLNQETSNAVREFNAADNGYRIEFVDYDEYDDENSYDAGGALLPGGWSKADFELQMDILKGDTVHIVPDSAFMDKGKFNLLSEKGAFIDLYSFLNEDEKINCKTLDSHVLSLFEIEGKLCYLPQFYWVETMIGKTEYVGEKENWSFSELKYYWDAMPHNATFNYSTDKYGVFNEILRGNLGAFIDYRNATCSFDSSDFVEMIDFCNTFHETTEDKVNPTADTPSFVMSMAFCGFEEYHRLLWTETNEEYTFVGYPSEDGNGAFLNPECCFAICTDASPDVQKGAWIFLQMLMEKEFCCEMYNNYNGLVGFPVNCAAFEQLAQEEMNRSEELQGKDGNMTQTEYERLTSYIKDINRTNISVEDGLWDILYEELDIFFAGNSTAEQTAKSIQGRSEIYISEKIG